MEIAQVIRRFKPKGFFSSVSAAWRWIIVGEMTNSYRVCHRGMISTLADATLAYASALYDTIDTMTVGELSNTSFLYRIGDPGKNGETIGIEICNQEKSQFPCFGVRRLLLKKTSI